MKDNRFKLTGLIAVALLAVGVGLGYAAQHFHDSNASGLGAGGSAASENRLGLDIDLLLSNVVARWKQVDGLTADINWQVHLFDHTLQGVGEYTQSGRGSSQRHGIILKGADPAAPMFFQQAVLASESVVWTQWKTSVDESASMVRLNDLAQANQEMPRAGIAHLIWRLQQSYAFTSIEHVVQGERQLLLVRGTKKVDAQNNAELLPFIYEQANGASLLLDAASGFPHRIQWESVGHKQRKPLVTIDLIHVRNGVSPNSDLLSPTTIVPDAIDQTEAYQMAVMSGAGGHY
ncbi:hypothetical protein C5Y96_15805 [Blastopirellula marina]|uniref:Uncharacterized protein n=1 Tax=Blastopirellula marina TaxID=124 RepID=A0A2S8FAQ6_9BACT|nr:MULTISPECIES: hypothetical protein [Pirellulaceae]PQO29210.1 hypothetical protein C5Y96_15805 [Blastopirellula marina]RCS50403.1 hypothetical protein DTL36_15825 [Bremerella cremea]